MRPENRLIKGATHVIKIVAASPLTEALNVSVQVKHSTRNFKWSPDFIIEGNALTFIWDTNHQPHLGIYEISCRAEYGQNSIGYCDWADIEGLELVEHSYQERARYSSTMETLPTVELHGDLVPTRNGMSAYDIWRAQGNEGTEADFLESLKGEPGPQGIPGVSGGMLFPKMDYDADTGELVITGLEAEVDRISFDEETGELVITL